MRNLYNVVLERPYLKPSNSLHDIAHTDSDATVK